MADPSSDMRHLDFIDAVVGADIAEVQRKEATYKGSWKRNGGSHAWQMILRKINRLQSMLGHPAEPHPGSLESVDGWLRDIRSGDNDRANAVVRGERADVIAWLVACARAGDIFHYIKADPSGADGTVLAEVRDLRRYLLLVEAEMIARGVVAMPECDMSEADQAILEDFKDRLREMGGSTLARGGEIEREFYRLKAQEWAVEPERARVVIQSLLDELPMDGVRDTTNEVISLAMFFKLRDREQTAIARARVREVMKEMAGLGLERLQELNAFLSGQLPGTPEDGGHHEVRWKPETELRDGIRADGSDNPPDWPHIITEDPLTGHQYYLIDRRAMDVSAEPLVRSLQRELNHKEWCETLPEYRGLYQWHEGPSKRIIEPGFEAWVSG